MSGGATPPLPLGAYRNWRSKTTEKILSSTRYLAVTWHHRTGCMDRGKKGHSTARAIWSRKNRNADTNTCFGIWKEFGKAVENTLSETTAVPQNHTHCRECLSVPHSCPENVIFKFFLRELAAQVTVVPCIWQVLLLLSQIPVYPLSPPSKKKKENTAV